MDGDRRGALRGRQSVQFKKEGSVRRGKRNSSRPGHHENTQVPNSNDTVYRILCPSKNIGSVIGKSGGIIKVLREETGSKITVSGTIPGSDERVIMIYSPPEKGSKKEPDRGVENQELTMAPHCLAQDALLRVHDRIIEDDIKGGNKDGEDDSIMATARLLVPNTMVGCLLGKGGDVIQKLRSETGANIRVLPSEHLPTCALSTDELVQIQGKPIIVKRALYEVSTLLHQNPRKENAVHVGLPSRGLGFQTAGPLVSRLPPARDPMWSPRHHSPHVLPPPFFDEYERYRGFPPSRFDDDLPRPGMEPSGEFSMKILCSASKIGGVIGKGGIIVRQLQEDTGTSIHVEDVSSQSEERVIRVSAFESLANPRSQTIDAILILQSKSSEVSDKGVITTRLLVPSNKVGCLLGQGGTIINEMRRRTHADIRVSSKDEKPECASEDEELVQVSGSFGVAKDALAEIADRLRARSLRDAGAEIEPPPPRTFQGYGPTGSFPRAGHSVPGPLGFSPHKGYSAAKGGSHDYEPPTHPVPPSASRFPISVSSAEACYQDKATVPVSGPGGSTYTHGAEAAGMRMKRDPYVGSESLSDIRGGSDHFSASAGVHHNYNTQHSSHQGAYLDPKGQAPYSSLVSQQTTYQSPHQNHQPTPYQSHQSTPYQSRQPTPYLSHQSTTDQSHQQPSYQNHQPTPYQQTGAPARQSPYQNVNAQYSAYPSAPAHGAYQY